MELKKKAFLEAYQKTFGNISQSCKAAEIDRGTYYNWIKADAEFHKAVIETEPEEQFLDFLESKLIKLANEDNPAAVIFALKTKGKKRGYVERQEMTGADGVPIMPTVVLQPDRTLQLQYDFKPEADDSLPTTHTG